jgi:hypothetical protein
MRRLGLDTTGKKEWEELKAATNLWLSSIQAVVEAVLSWSASFKSGA